MAGFPFVESLQIRVRLAGMEINPYAAPLAPTEVAPTTASGAVRVGFWPRFAAGIIDLVLVWVIGVLISGAVVSAFPGYLTEAIARSQAKIDPKVAAQMSAMLGFAQTMTRWLMGTAVVSVAYQLLTEGLFGRSLGKLMLGIRIADLNAHKAAVGRLLGRASLKQLSNLLVIVAMMTNKYVLSQVAQVPGWLFIIGCFFVFARNRRALHDWAAGTAVYRNSDVT
jgi:uncharacterized RDD family membrane protein YckC